MTSDHPWAIRARKGTIMTTISTMEPAAGAASAAVSGAWAHHGHRGHNPVQAVSSLLGMDPADVTGGLKGGKSLDDIASEHGVSHSDLVNAIVAGMPERMRTSDRATPIAEKIAARKGLPAPPPPRPEGPATTSGTSGMVEQSPAGVDGNLFDASA
jgi:hypothetical protein